MENHIIERNNILASWKSYEYVGPDHIYNPVQLQKDGGPGGAPYIWADDTMWSIDTPEKPASILSLIFYRNWTGLGPIDLREAIVKFFLRGENLDLKGGQCFFWILTCAPQSTRWHYTAQPIQISDGDWGDLIELKIENNTAMWHRSFSTNFTRPCSLNQTLGACISYGFSFGNFSDKVTGKLALSSFEIEAEQNPSWPYAADYRDKVNFWERVSNNHRRQISATLKYTMKQKESIVHINNDFMEIKNTVPFSYLSLIKSDDSTHGADLSDAFIIVSQNKNKFESGGGQIIFFIEHTDSNTIWMYRRPFIEPLYCMVLDREEQFWFRLTGNASLDSILSGNNGLNGYNYLGLLVVNNKKKLTGIWELLYFSVGPQIERENDISKVYKH